ncbi:MAG: hypothetical protein Kow00108_25220 [Calditrichia bacterium]
MESIQQIYTLATQLDDITSRCLKCVKENDFSSLNNLLSERETLLSEIIQHSQRFFSESQEDVVENSELKNLMKKITKDSQHLVEYISEEKKGVVDHIKQLRRGRSSLTHLKEKVRHKKVVSKLI